MTNKEFLEEVFRHAAEDAPQSFEFIRSVGEWAHARKYKRGLKIIIKLLSKAVKDLTKDIQKLDKIKEKTIEDLSISDLRLCALAAREQFIATINFYRGELYTIVDMLKEFRSYFFANNNLITIGFLGRYRPEEDLVDFRTLPISFF